MYTLPPAPLMLGPEPANVNPPVILILPVPVISLLFKSKSPPSCGVVSSTILLKPPVDIPVSWEPSPNNFPNEPVEVDEPLRFAPSLINSTLPLRFM